MTAEYIDLFESMNAELVKEQKNLKDSLPLINAAAG
jgi:hypothetical protein